MPRPALFLAGKAFYATFAHTDQHIDRYLAAASEVFAVIAQARQQESLADLLRGPVAHHGFRRLT